MARRKIDFKYQEYDIPDTEEIEKYMKMSEEELEALIEKRIEEDRRKYQREREHGRYSSQERGEVFDDYSWKI